MSKKDKIFIRWITVLVPLLTLCAFAGGIIIYFNKLIGLIFSGIGICGIFLGIMIPYIIYCIGGLIKLMKEEE